MTRRQHHYSSPLLVALLGLAWVSSFSKHGGAAEPTASAEVQNRPRILYRQAESAFSAGRVDEARKLLLEAWGIRPTYDVAAALGQAELELKLYRDAAEHLDYAVQHFAPMESEQLLNDTKNDLRLAKSEVVEARITVNEARAKVTANGRPVGESPLTASLFLEPGSYTFAAALSEDRRVARPIVLQKGGTYDISLVVPPPVAAVPPSADESPRRASPNYVPPGISAAVGGVALATGVGLLVAASSKDSAREQLQQRLPGSNACGPGSENAGECAEISRLAWSASHLRTGAVVAFGSAVAAGVLTYLLWPSARREQTSFLLSPSFSYEARSMDLSATGRF